MNLMRKAERPLEAILLHRKGKVSNEKRQKIRPRGSLLAVVKMEATLWPYID